MNYAGPFIDFSMQNCAKRLKISFIIKLAFKVAKGKVTLTKFKETVNERRLKVKIPPLDEKCTKNFFFLLEIQFEQLTC